MKLVSLAICSLVILALNVTGQRVLHVPGDYGTIQAAIDAAQNQDTVLVDRGFYPEFIDFKGKNITVKSLHGPAATAIDAQGKFSVVSFRGGEGPEAILEGFTITGGRAPYGGGIFCNHASPTLRFNHIVRNKAVSFSTSGAHGGGIYCWGGRPTIQGNLIQFNTAEPSTSTLEASAWGGGLALWACSATVVSNVISGNEARAGGANGLASGGGLFVTGTSSASVKVTNNTIVNYGTGSAVLYGESGEDGVMLSAFDADHNCYFAPNSNKTVETQIGTYAGSLAGWKDFLKKNQNMIPLGGGTTYDDSSLEGDPGLVSLTSPYDIRLKNGSRCIDAGTLKYVAGPWVTFDPNARVLTDFEGTPRPDTVKVDMGADELGPSITRFGSGQIGTVMNLVLSAPLDPGRPFQVGSSLGTGPIRFDNRNLNLSWDGILFLSITGLAPGTFIKYTGNLDAQGTGTAAISIPEMPELVGFDFHTAFITLDPAAPSGIRSISDTRSFRVVGK